MSLFTDTGEIDPTKDYFSELVGEGKKYKTNQDVGRALMEGTLTIKQRDQELAQVRATLAERVKLEDLMNEIKTIANRPPNSDADNQNTNGTEKKEIPSLTPEQIDERLNKKLSELRQEDQAKVNEALAKEKLIQKFGHNYPSKLKEEASKLNMTTTQLDQVAATNPAAFLRLVGAEDVKQQSQHLFTPPVGVQTTFVPSTSDRTQAWYQQLRKDNPVLYASREMQIQQHKDAERIGESFFDVQ